MITALIICITVILCVVWYTLWVTYMSRRALPMWLHAECVHKEDPEPVSEPNTIGFVQADTTKHTEEKTLSDKELREQVLQDTASTISALLRGEVDFDDIKQ